MRDYQTKANVGGVPDSITTTKLGAGEANSVLTENENAVERAGLTLAPADGSGEDTTQLAQSLFIHSVKAQQFQDGGSANVYELTPISGSSGVLLPGGYGVLDGARLWFSPGAANTGASTVNIGQTSGGLLGAKALLTAGGAALSGGELQANVDVEIIYSSTADGGSGGWLLASASSAATETTRGIVELATDVEAQGFTANKYIDGAKLNTSLKGGNQSLAASGFQKLPGGLILQWGESAGGGSTGTVSFPIAFPNAVLSVTTTDIGASPTENIYIGIVPSTTNLTQFGYAAIKIDTAVATDPGLFYWMAIGY